MITINRARRLKPKVALVLTASKSPSSTRIICDLMEHTDAAGQEIKISRVLPTGAYDINPMDHIVQLWTRPEAGAISPVRERSQFWYTGKSFRTGVYAHQAGVE